MYRWLRQWSHISWFVQHLKGEGIRADDGTGISTALRLSAIHCSHVPTLNCVFERNCGNIKPRKFMHIVQM